MIRLVATFSGGFAMQAGKVKFLKHGDPAASFKNVIV
jgi:hypothetical protein